MVTLIIEERLISPSLKNNYIYINIKSYITYVLQTKLVVNQHRVKHINKLGIIKNITKLLISIKQLQN